MAGVLIVEDEPWLGELYTRLLVKAGHKVRWCRDGYGALELINEARPDVILLDLFLPWVNGLQLLHELVSYSDLFTIPVILCSSSMPEHLTPEHLKPYGIFAALDKLQTKPGEIITTIQKALNANLQN